MKKFKVVRFQLAVNTPEGSEFHNSHFSEGVTYRDYVTLGESLSWEDAKDLRQANNGSWIVKQ
jgi:hypothetical protein